MPALYAKRPPGFVGLALMVTLGCGGDSAIIGALTVGAIEVRAVTTGQEPDPDGYHLIVDDALDFPLNANGSARIGHLDPGLHLLRLEGLESNCQIAGSNPRSVNVPLAGLAAVTFSVTCVQFTGSIRVTTATTGTELDPDGYVVVVDQDDYYPREGEPIDRDGTLTFARVPGGEHSVSLEDVARNCLVVGSNPRAVAVAPGVETSVTFVVQCERAGHLRVITQTSGTDVDPTGYTAGIVTAQFDTATTLLGTDTVTVALPRGDFTVTLGGLTTNCELAGANGRMGTIHSGDTAEVKFDVACVAAGELAFVTDRDGNPEIYVIKANGADPSRRTVNTAGDDEPAWSPDGSRIVLRTARDGNDEIYLMNADGTNPVRLTNHPDADGMPAWSPDGSRIAFLSYRAGNSEIYVMNADGSNPIRLTSHPGADVDPTWSPDGQRIAFASYRNNSHDIYVMNADGSGQVPLTSGDHDDRSPAWSPGGSKIAFSRSVDCYYYCAYDLHVMSADGSGVTAFPLATCDETDPAWSPDGTRIAFTSRQSYYGYSCSPSVMVMRADGTRVTLITNEGAWAPAWRP